MLRYLSFGHAQVPTWYLAHAAAILVSGQYAYVRMVRGGVASRVATTALALIIGGALGSLYLARWFAAFGHEKGWFPHDAASAGGGALVIVVAGGLLGQAWWRVNSLPAGRMWDLVIFPVPLAQAIGRVGCFLAGCCHGRPTTSPFGVPLPDHFGLVESRWPTQLLSMAGNLAIFAFLLRLERRGRGETGAPPLPPGTLALTYLLLFAAKRGGVEFFRASWRPVIGPFSTAQLAAIAMAIVAGVAIVRLRRRRPTDLP